MAVISDNTDKALVPPLLGADEPHPASIVNPDGAAKFFFICDHASNRIPAKLGTLGVDDAERQKHSFWDIGAGEVTLRLAEIFDAPAIVANYSRMVVDLNRRLDHPTCIPTSSEGHPVAANLRISKEEETMRIDEIYRPYHQSVANMVDDFIARGIVPAMISVHSYTPVFYGDVRPWQLAALWAQDQRIPRPFIEGMREKGYKVGDNEPYDARILRGATTHIHADGRGLPNLLVEYRNDLLRDDGQREKLIEDTADVLRPILEDDRLFSVYDGPVTPHDLAMEAAYFENAIRTTHKN